MQFRSLRSSFQPAAYQLEYARGAVLIAIYPQDARYN
jgi:hypothetical protein